MAIGYALAAGQMAFGLADMFQRDKIADQQYINSVYDTTFQNQVNELRTEAANKAIADEFQSRLDFVKKQVENNFLGAEASWTAEQMRLNEINDRYAYQSVAMKKMLDQAVGSAAAREVYGKSARRGALISTLGNYGRTKRQAVEELLSQQNEAQRNMKETERKFKAAQDQALAQVSVLPTFQSFTPMAQPTAPSTSGWQRALQIGQLGMGAFQTGLAATPKEFDFFGIKGQAQYG